MENAIHESVQEFLEKLGCTVNKIKVDFDQKTNTNNININSDQSSQLIGHRGETINALQHLIKLVLWKKHPSDKFEVAIDIDNYKKRQEERVIKMTDRKVELVRKISSPQSLPPMSPYLRRVVHLYLAQDQFSDIRTESHGEGDLRYVVIKPQLTI